MCGFAGWFGEGVAIDAVPLRLKAMAASIQHRGPDGEGVWSAPGVGLAHRRLAIIDLATGHQPLVSHDQRYVIAYNGEIYNFRELRTELRSAGSTFSTDSDTEVIVELYRQDGWKGFRRLRGMFAFALWDNHTATGVLVRDSVGVKPLFVYSTSSQLVFGSEAKAILAWGVRPELDCEALHGLMNLRYLPDNRTLFKGITQLNPGEVVQFHRGKTNIYSLGLPTPDFDTPIELLLERAVSRHMVADVPVGAYLSGGVDSGLICALAKKAGNPPNTYTLPVGDDPLEAGNAEATANILGLNNQLGGLPQLKIEDLKRQIWFLETPKSNAWQSFKLADMLPLETKAVLSGLGGDELFYGYNVHQWMAYLEFGYRGFGPLTRLSGKGLTWLLSRMSRQPWSEPYRAAMLLARLPNWSSCYGMIRNVWDTQENRRWLYGEQMLDADLPDMWEWLNDRWPAGGDPVSCTASFEFEQKMVNDLLWNEDRAGMACGKEIRPPFLDLDLVARLRATPRAELMPGFKKKQCLRTLAESALSPDISRRKKSGFQLDMPSLVGQLMASISPTETSLSLFAPDFIHNATVKNRTNRWLSFILFLGLNMNLWVETFLESTPTKNSA